MKKTAALEETFEPEVPEIIGDPAAWEIIHETRLGGGRFTTRRFKLTNGSLYYTETLLGGLLSTSTTFVPN